MGRGTSVAGGDGGGEGGGGCVLGRGGDREGRQYGLHSERTDSQGEELMFVTMDHGCGLPQVMGEERKKWIQVSLPF